MPRTRTILASLSVLCGPTPRRVRRESDGVHRRPIEQVQQQHGRRCHTRGCHPDTDARANHDAHPGVPHCQSDARATPPH
jgi:hypothetical protein